MDFLLLLEIFLVFQRSKVFYYGSYFFFRCRRSCFFSLIQLGNEVGKVQLCINEQLDGKLNRYVIV